MKVQDVRRVCDAAQEQVFGEAVGGANLVVEEVRKTDEPGAYSARASISAMLSEVKNRTPSA